MSKLTVAVGFLLVLIGVAGYVYGVWDASQDPQAGKASVTALIPAFFGLPVTALGAVGIARPRLRKHVMHAAVMLTLLGALGGLGMGLPHVGELFERWEKPPVATMSKLAMGVVCLVHVILGVRSFIAARRARQASAGGGEPV